MRIERAQSREAKGWYAGPWDSTLAISLGYANVGIDEPHLHKVTTEIYLVARGSCEMRVGREVLHLEANDVVVVEPGEPHTFVTSSADYFHFVIHTPGLAGEAASEDKVAVSRDTVGL